MALVGSAGAQFVVALLLIAAWAPVSSADDDGPGFEDLPTVGDRGSCVCPWIGDTVWPEGDPVWIAPGAKGVMVGPSREGYAVYYGVQYDELPDPEEAVGCANQVVERILNHEILPEDVPDAFRQCVPVG